MSLVPLLVALTLVPVVQDPRNRDPRTQDPNRRSSARRVSGAERPIEASPEKAFRLFIAGDTVMTRPWSQRKEPEFTALVEEMRSADATLVNFEMLLHSFDGIYPERYEGQGTPLAADPKLARELQWAGVDIAFHAHDHTYDYGALAVLETQRHVEGYGIVLAGSGADLQHARGPSFYYHRNGFVGVVATASSSSFTRTGVATPSCVDLHGKPGVNPLSSGRSRSRWGFSRRGRGGRGGTPTTITEATAKKLVKIAKEEGIEGVSIGEVSGGRGLEFLGRRFVIGKTNSMPASSGSAAPADVEANLEAVRKADKDADIAVFSVHAKRPGDWLQDVAHQAIDAGADVCVAHGALGIRGIEIYKGKPILYGLGYFVFQEETVERLPAEYLEHLGLPLDTPAEEVMRSSARAWSDNPIYWQSLAVTVQYRKDGEVDEIRLLPLTLGQDQGFGVRGTPRLADARLGKELIARVAAQSKPYKTRIRYDAKNNVGVVAVR